jgi:hypothetical protein
VVRLNIRGRVQIGDGARHFQDHFKPLSRAAIAAESASRTGRTLPSCDNSPIVDYGPVKFNSTNLSLWLPSHADMYFEMQGRRYHHRHTLTDYVLFDVDTKNKITAPAEPVTASDN